MAHGGDFYEEYEDPDEESWSDAGRGRRWGLIAFVAVSILSLVVGLGAIVMLLSGGGDGPRRNSSAADALPAVSAESPTPEVTEATPTPTPSKSAKPKVVPSKNPAITAAPPPPPVTKTAAPGCTPTYSGTAATKAQVRAELKAASIHSYWASKPEIKMPERLLMAVAMNESTWQSNVIACDGGIGLMQVMPDTVKQINNRFGTKWDVNTLYGNTNLGANYLAWSTVYLGDKFFGGSYDLTNPALLNSVISAYNVGAGDEGIDPTKGEAGIPNPTYVNRVKGYMATCPCDSW